MLQRLEEIIGCKVGATDGQIGEVKDALFDEEKWAIRHLVVDTGSWLKGNQVLISPIAVRGVDLDGRMVQVELTKQQIEEAPSITSDQPVSRQYETSYYSHYGWPSYWGGPMLWGAWAYPTMAGAGVADPITPASEGPPMNSAEREMEERRLAEQDINLHSFNKVNGYKVAASDGSLGDIEDMIIDTESWKVRYFVVDTSKFLPSKDVLLPPEDVEAIAFHDSAVNVAMTKEQLKDQPEFTSVEAIHESASEGPVTLSRQR